VKRRTQSNPIRIKPTKTKLCINLVHIAVLYFVNECFLFIISYSKRLCQAFNAEAASVYVSVRFIFGFFLSQFECMLLFFAFNIVFQSSGIKGSFFFFSLLVSLLLKTSLRSRVVISRYCLQVKKIRTVFWSISIQCPFLRPQKNRLL
jgi:hypothetical protein